MTLWAENVLKLIEIDHTCSVLKVDS